ncbi:MAG: hypothetical protein ACRDPR_09745, partial [Nocardioidaceae bacterium]
MVWLVPIGITRFRGVGSTWYPGGAAVSVTVHGVPDGPVMAMEPAVDVPLALTVPSGLVRLAWLRPVMIVAGRVTLGLQTTLKDAPGS